MTHDGDEGIAGRKRELRQRLRGIRGRLIPETRATASRVIAAYLDTLPELAVARRILAYAAMPTEVNLDEWLRVRLCAGVRVLLPWVDGSDLRVGSVRDLDLDVQPGWRGVREPSDRADDLVDVHAAVVPGLAFERTGRRLGQGGGHIDRLLSRLGPEVPVVGVAFAAQLVEEGMIPVAPHDVAVDIVVTEEGVWRGGRTARLQAL